MSHGDRFDDVGHRKYSRRWHLHTGWDSGTRSRRSRGPSLVPNCGHCLATLRPVLRWVGLQVSTRWFSLRVFLYCDWRIGRFRHRSVTFEEVLPERKECSSLLCFLFVLYPGWNLILEYVVGAGEIIELVWWMDTPGFVPFAIDSVGSTCLD